MQKYTSHIAKSIQSDYENKMYRHTAGARVTGSVTSARINVTRERMSWDNAGGRANRIASSAASGSLEI